MDHSYFVSGIKLLLIVCFPQHLSREEYPSGHAGGICDIFPSVKELRPFSLEMMRGNKKRFGVCCQSVFVPFVKKTISVIISCQFKPGK